MTKTTHKDLDVWKLSIQLVKDIYQLTSKFPSEEKFGLTAQIRRSAVSVPSNISEGAARNSNKDYVRFLYIALGSLSEIETQLIIAKELSFSNNIDQLMDQVVLIRPKLLNLIKYLKSK
jgi:four helix bundle protein